VSNTALSTEFIRQICTTYKLNEQDLQSIMGEHQALKMYIAMLRAAIEASDEPNADFIAMLTRIMAHMDNTVVVIKRLQNVARQVNGIMGEFEA
jgi:hypothetical protein